MAESKVEIEDKATSESLHVVEQTDPDLESLYAHTTVLLDKPAEVCAFVYNRGFADINNGNFYTQHEADFTAMIELANKSAKTKVFSAQNLPRFIKYFPQHAQAAINAFIAQCESDDATV